MAQRKALDEEQRQKLLHDKRVIERNRSAPSQTWVSTRQRELARLLKADYGVDAGQAVSSLVVYAIGAFVATLLVIWAVDSRAGESWDPDEISTAYTGIAIVAVIALGLWIRGLVVRHMRGTRRATWQQELADIPYLRGCGQRSCRDCYRA